VPRGLGNQERHDHPEDTQQAPLRGDEILIHSPDDCGGSFGGRGNDGRRPTLQNGAGGKNGPDGYRSRGCRRAGSNTSGADW
jgi:hypothetical protein